MVRIPLKQKPQTTDNVKRFSSPRALSSFPTSRECLMWECLKILVRDNTVRSFVLPLERSTRLRGPTRASFGKTTVDFERRGTTVSSQQQLSSNRRRATGTPGWESRRPPPQPGETLLDETPAFVRRKPIASPTGKQARGRLTSLRHGAADVTAGSRRSHRRIPGVQKVRRGRLAVFRIM